MSGNRYRTRVAESTATCGSLTSVILSTCLFSGLGDVLSSVQPWFQSSSISLGPQRRVLETGKMKSSLEEPAANHIQSATASSDPHTVHNSEMPRQRWLQMYKGA